MESQNRQFTAVVQWATSSFNGRLAGTIAVLDGTLPDVEQRAVSLVSDGKRVLVYGGVLHSSRVLRLISLGVRGYVPETATLSVLLSAVRNISDDGTHLPFDPDPGREYIALTAAEQVAAHAYFVEAPGLPRVEVARRLGIADATLRNHLASVRRKLGVAPRTSRAAVSRRYQAVPR
ncbi:hypothetical protein ACIPY2_12595 [Paenarthrobacter sp. NPDC089675]|uniref:helix-turn-helix transcriptional regulator n=1 Tax=Paenarthrobacter sp. NPDC089675 TaxID=3364376 RepID=UPI0037F4A9FC